MDTGRHTRGKQQCGPRKEPKSKLRKSLRSKSSKQPTSSTASSVPPAATLTGGDGCTESPALSPLPGAPSAVASGGGASRPSVQSKSVPRGAAKSSSSGTGTLQPSAELPEQGAEATAALNKSKPSLDVIRSKPSDLAAIPGATHMSASRSRAAGIKDAGGAGSSQDLPAAPAAGPLEPESRADVGGAYAVDAPVVVSKHPPGAHKPAVQPPKANQAGHRQRRKSKAASSARNRDVDVNNRYSAEESFTPLSSREGGMKKTNVLSWSHWSFYPLNVTFVTEMNTKEQRCLFAVAVGVLAVVFALGVVAVILLVFSAKPPTRYVMCDTAECIEAHDYLNRLLNTSKDTCGDFYAYVCDSWLDRGADEDGPDSFLADSAAASYSTITKSLLHQSVQQEKDQEKTELPYNQFNGDEGATVLNALYQRCRLYVSEKTTTEAFKATLTAVRERLNWTLIRKVRRYGELMGHIARTSLMTGFHTVFALDLLSENGRAVLRLSSGRSLLGKLAMSGNREELESHLRLVVEDSRELALVLSIDELIADELDFDEGVVMDDDSLPLDALLENLVPEVTTSDWMVSLNTAIGFGEQTMRVSDTALSHGALQVRSALNKIYNRSTLSEAALYLALHLDADLLSLELSRERAAARVSKTAHFCLDLARRCFGYAWPRLVARLLDLDQNGLALYEMFHELKDASRHAPIFSWLPERTWYDAVGKVERATLIFVSEDAQAGTRGEPDYALLARFVKETNGGGFVGLFVRVLEHEHSQRLLQPPTRLQLLLLRLEQRSQLMYSASLGSVLVPTLFQRPPLLYSARVPVYFNYGTVGALLAAAIVDVIAPVTINRSDQPKDRGKQNDIWWTPETLRKYNESSHCLQRLHRRLGLQAQVAGSDEEQRRTMFLGAHGLRLAYDSLATSFRRARGNSDAFSALWLGAQIVFFARFCLLWCKADQRPAPLSPRGNCLLPLHTMPEFDTAFECAQRANFVSDNCVV